METENIEKVKVRRKKSRKWLTLTLEKIPMKPVHDALIDFQKKINYERKPRFYTIKEAYVEYLIEKVAQEPQTTTI